MRSFPKTILMRGRTWKLNWLKGLQDKAEAYGITMVAEQSITVDPSASNSQQLADTIVHELLHVCYASTSLPHIVDEEDKEQRVTEEIIVDSLAPAVLSLIVDNPELIEAIRHLMVKDD